MILVGISRFSLFTDLDLMKLRESGRGGEGGKGGGGELREKYLRVV